MRYRLDSKELVQALILKFANREIDCEMREGVKSVCKGNVISK
jgi:hypothetical protein